MSYRIEVRAYSGYKANERPQEFSIDKRVIDISEIEDRWYDPDAEYFRVRSKEGKRYILRCSREDEWTLQSGFDAAELLARPDIELISVPPSVIHQAESRIAACAGCSDNRADRRFDSIIAEVMNKDESYAFLLSEQGHCPRCNAQLSEKTRVERQL